MFVVCIYLAAMTWQGIIYISECNSFAKIIENLSNGE